MNATPTRRTVAEVFGEQATDQLARWAIDVLAGPDVPEGHSRTTMDAKVPWSEIERGRAVLEAAGIDWRKLHHDARQTRQERRA